LEARLIPVFFQLLQQGFMMKAQVGCSIKTLLCEQFGLNPDYLEKKIQTIFLDGKPVDDFDSAIVNSGSILALSAAMPGLVGAILRRGGHYAPMRDQISHKGETGPISLQEGMISLKLFNIVLKEVGPAFLKRGIWINGKDLEDFVKRQSDDFWSGCKAAQVDGEKIDSGKLPQVEWPNQQVYLQVEI
jgi:hypothetical protein